MINFHSVKLSS